MKVRFLTIFIAAAVIALVVASGAFAVDERVTYNLENPEGYWDYLCPTGSTAVLDESGFPLLDEDCVAEYLTEYLNDSDPLANTGDDQIQEIPVFVEKCVICEQQVTEVTETPTVQQDAYTAAAASTRSSLPSTGLMLLPAAGLLAAGAGVMLARRRS